MNISYADQTEIIFISLGLEPDFGHDLEWHQHVILVRIPIGITTSQLLEPSSGAVSRSSVPHWI